MQKIKKSAFQLSSNSIRVAEIVLNLILIVNYYDYFLVFKYFFGSQALLSPLQSLDLFEVLRFVPASFLGSEPLWSTTALVWLGILLSIFNIVKSKSSKYLYILHFLIMSLFFERYPHVFGPADLALRLTTIWMFFLVQVRPSQFTNTLDKKIINVFWFVQIIIIYILSTFEKLKFPEWSTSLDAIGKLSEIERHVSFMFVRLIQSLPDFVIQLTTFGVLFLEGVLILFLLSRKEKIRNILILLFIIFHLCIMALMKVHIISYVAIMWWIVFIPDKFWNIVPENLKSLLFKNNIDPYKQSKFSITYPLYFLVVLVSFSVVANFIPEKLKYLKPAVLANRLHIGQRWTMFSNSEMLARDQYIKISVMLNNSEAIDLLTKDKFNISVDSFKEHNLKAMFVINFYKYFVLNKSKSADIYLKFLFQNAQRINPNVKFLEVFIVENKNDILYFKSISKISNL
jgi:hypothetical protein